MVSGFFSGGAAHSGLLKPVKMRAMIKGFGAINSAVPLST